MFSTLHFENDKIYDKPMNDLLFDIIDDIPIRHTTNWVGTRNLHICSVYKFTKFTMAPFLVLMVFM